jgi:hypothetical protein
MREKEEMQKQEETKRIIVRADTETKPTELLVTLARLKVQQEIVRICESRGPLSPQDASMLNTLTRLILAIDKGFEETDGAEEKG